jgi:PAS domain-containing protein/predicted PurR-regulated permease PerM
MKKLLSIPKKLQYFALSLILFIASVLFIQIAAQHRIANIRSAEQQIGFIKANIETINALHHEMLSSLLFERIENTAILDKKDKQISSDLANLSESISRLTDTRIFKRNEDSFRSLDTFTGAVADFSLANSILMTTMKERGNIYEGIISAWIKQTADIEASAGTGNQDLLIGLGKMKALQSAYLMTMNISLIESLNSLVISLQSQLPAEEVVLPGKFDTFLQLTAAINALDSRLGFFTRQGELPAYEKAYDTVNATFENLSSVVKKNIHKKTGSVYIVYIGFILFLFTVFMFLGYFAIDRSTLRPIHTITDYMTALARGTIPENRVEINPSDDPGGISDEMNKLAKGLSTKTIFARDLNQGRLDSTIELLSESDELGLEMKKLQDRMVSSAEEQSRYNEDNARRRYINEGLAKFGNLLRQHSSNLTDLGDSFIRELVKYLNAIQGGFFILDDSDKERPVLRLMAAYAYNRKKYLEKTILMGEGLVGTCAIEKKTIHLTEMPEGYISITSGLGEAPPDNLILVPVLHEEELIGVLEIASLSKFSDYEMKLTEELAGNLGSTIITTRINQRTSDLLDKSQQQAVEMAEQEEEMRQNMEELKATQEESARREEEFRGIVNSLNLSLFLMEYDLDGRIIFINEKFLFFLNKTGDEVIGKSHIHIFGSKSVVDSKFWNQMSNISNTTLYEKLMIGKKAYLMKEHFAVVTNRDGLPVKVLNIITEIPEKP